MIVVYVLIALIVPILILFTLHNFWTNKECKSNECNAKKIRIGRFGNYEEAKHFFRNKFPNINLEYSSMHRVSVLMYFGWNVSIDSRKRYLVFTRKLQIKEFRIGDRLKSKQFLIPSKSNSQFNNW